MNGVGVRPQVSETTESNERKLSGTTRLFTGFVIGALFALAPMYYFYIGREAALREGHAAPEARFAAPRLRVESEAADGSAPPFASRMTYELSRLPEEPLPVVARAPIAAVTPAPRAPAAIAQPVPPPPATRVADARPISTRPPEPRDRTSAIEQEAQRADYREPPLRDAVAVRAKNFEGRKGEPSKQSLPQTQTKPISADVPVDSPGRSAGAPVAGVSPITRPPAKPEAPEVVAIAGTVSAVGGASGPAPDAQGADGRFAATREWLNAAAGSTHTIQLMGTSTEAQLDAQLKSLGKMLDPSRLYVYRTVAQGKPSITVVYGEYPDRKSALQALDKLPVELVANKPVLRTVNGIRAEMKQHKTDG